MRKGISGLAMLAQAVLLQKPASGAVFAFRGRRGDRLKLLYWDGQGFCLYYKVLERDRFPWPSAADETARLTSARGRVLSDARASRRIRRANAMNSTPAVPVRIAGAPCASLAKT